MNSKKFSTQTESSLIWTVAPGQKVSDLDRVMAIGKANGWDFRVCGRGKIMTSPVLDESGWTLIPLDQVNSILPSDATQRLWTVLDAWIPIDGIFVAYEPKPTKDKPTQTGYDAPPIPTKELAPRTRPNPGKKPLVTGSGLAKAGVNVASATGKAGLQIAKVGGKVVVGSAAVVGAVVAGVARGIGELILVDPTINVVLSQPGNPWVELYVWYEE